MPALWQCFHDGQRESEETVGGGGGYSGEQIMLQSRQAMVAAIGKEAQSELTELLLIASPSIGRREDKPPSDTRA